MIDVTCFNWIKMIQKSKLSSNAKYIAHYLSTYMNHNQDVAWPSQSRIISEMGISKDTLCKKLRELEASGWLVRERGGPTTNTRYMINVPIEAVEEFALNGSTASVLGSTTTVLGVVRPPYTNNNSNNNRVLAKRKRFTPPTLSEVSDYCKERNNNVDAQRFVDHYEANGWVQGRGKRLKCWKAAVRTWEKNSFSDTKNTFEGIL